MGGMKNLSWINICYNYHCILCLLEGAIGPIGGPLKFPNPLSGPNPILGPFIPPLANPLFPNPKPLGWPLKFPLGTGPLPPCIPKPCGRNGPPKLFGAPG